MHCKNCSAENPEVAKFCIQCANPFLRACEKCAFENPPQAKFCAQCAAPLNAPSPASPSGPAPVPTNSESSVAIAGERRHLTVLFCDVVGSTAIAAGLDPEEWRETLARFHRVAAAAITQFDGYVAKNLGDGVMAFFGWPQAHDNDAESAARAGLAILDAVTKLNDQPGHAKLSVRVGINSGPVVMGKGAGTEVDVFGDTSNIASRVEGEAVPGTVAISGATHRLLVGLFVVEDLGAHELKGIEQPTQLYRVVRPSGARGRFEAATAAGGLTPFVGREDELCTLTRRWQRALDGDGQVALIIGEAGIGKSRLLQRFHQQIADTPHTWIGAGAGAFFQNTPFYPVVEMLRQFLGNTPVEDQLAQLESRLELAGLKPADAIPLIAPLLNLPLSEKYPLSTLSPEQQRRLLLATLVEWVIGSAHTQPLVIATEDLHWVDPSTLELIQLLVEQGATTRLLLLYTARSEFHAPWPMRAHHTQLTLNRLSAGNVRTMVAQVSASKALTDDTIATMIERTGGIPLFVEELTRDMLERGNSTPREIPATLHDSLMARLDRLGPDKEVLQIGSVIGSEFSYELLHAVHPIEEIDLQRALRAGTDAELLYIRGIAPDATFQFKHALIRDTAYEALLKTRRKELHRTVAQTIDEQFPTLKESHPEVLARHWTEAGKIEPAIAEWSRAGQRAVERRAYREGEQHYRAALGILQSLPESIDRDTHELNLQVALGNLMAATRGFSGAATREVQSRVQSLAERGVGDKSLQAFMGLWGTAAIRGEARRALGLADHLMKIAKGIGSPSAFVSAHYAQGFTRHCLGDLIGARDHFQLAMDVYREEDFAGVSQNPGVATRIFMGSNEWYLGYPDSALRFAKEAISFASRLENPIALAGAITLGSATIYGRTGDFRRAVEASDEGVSMSTELNLQHYNAIGKINGAWARAQMGEVDGALDRIREGLAELNPQQSHVASAKYLSQLCETEQIVGALDAALVTLEGALQINPDVQIYRPELLRLRARLKLKQGSDSQANCELAEQDLRESLKLARCMKAKSIELLNATSLARLLYNIDRRAEARIMLAEVYNWFTEGFDTADLKDAKALLDELSG